MAKNLFWYLPLPKRKFSHNYHSTCVIVKQIFNLNMSSLWDRERTLVMTNPNPMTIADWWTGPRAMDIAARHGHLRAVKWIHVNRLGRCTTDAMDNAARYGHFEIIKWLHKNRQEGCTTSAMDHAACNGHFEIVKWLHYNRVEGCTKTAINGAARKGFLEIVKWLRYNRLEGFTRKAINSAIVNGHISTVKFLYSEYHLKPSKAVVLRSMFKYPDIAQWLHINGYPVFADDE